MSTGEEVMVVKVKRSPCVSGALHAMPFIEQSIAFCIVYIDVVYCFVFNHTITEGSKLQKREWRYQRNVNITGDFQAQAQGCLPMIALIGGNLGPGSTGGGLTNANLCCPRTAVWMGGKRGCALGPRDDDAEPETMVGVSPL